MLRIIPQAYRSFPIAIAAISPFLFLSHARTRFSRVFVLEHCTQHTWIQQVSIMNDSCSRASISKHSAQRYFCMRRDRFGFFARRHVWRVKSAYEIQFAQPSASLIEKYVRLSSPPLFPLAALSRDMTRIRKSRRTGGNG